MVGQSFGRRMGTVCGREGVIDKDIAVFSERCDKGRIILFLAFMEAGVFEAKNVAILHASDSSGRLFANAVFGKSDFAPKHSFGYCSALVFSDCDGSGPSFGRPKWASKMTFAPLSDSSWIVGATRSMRVRSVTLPSAIGTLRSTRRRMRLPDDIADLVECFETAHCKLLQSTPEICAGPYTPRLPAARANFTDPVRNCATHRRNLSCHLVDRQEYGNARWRDLRFDRDADFNDVPLLRPDHARSVRYRRAAAGRHIRRARRAAPS